MKIMAIDDDTFMLEMLQGILWNAGHREVSICPSAKHAMNILARAEDPYTCILLDIDMPEMDGVVACRKIREIAGYEEVPIIMLTAMLDQHFVEASFEAGATDYVTKPFHIDDISARVKDAENMDARFNRSRAIERLVGMGPRGAKATSATAPVALRRRRVS